MAWRNGPDSFGLVTRAIHWTMALGIIGMLALGTRIAGMEPGLANLWLYGLHKSVGLILLALALIRLAWHRISPPPRPMGGGWPAALARLTHGAIYLLLLVIPLSGWVASAASGLDVMFLDRWTLPRIAPVSVAWEDAGWAVHGAATKLLMALIALHVAGALKRKMEGDGTLTRMIKGRRP
jgi:cytochrome b561